MRFLRSLDLRETLQKIDERIIRHSIPFDAKRCLTVKSVGTFSPRRVESLPDPVQQHVVRNQQRSHIGQPAAAQNARYGQPVQIVVDASVIKPSTSATMRNAHQLLKAHGQQQPQARTAKARRAELRILTVQYGVTPRRYHLRVQRHRAIEGAMHRAAAWAFRILRADVCSRAKSVYCIHGLTASSKARTTSGSAPPCPGHAPAA